MKRKSKNTGSEGLQNGGDVPSRGFTRRSFLARAGATTGAAATAQVWLSGVSRAGGGAGRPTLVIVNQRGAADGLSICAPVTDSVYTTQRNPGNTLVPPPASMSDRAWLEYDKFAMGPGGVDANEDDWLRPYHAGHLGFVHAVGLTGQSRSHFAAMAAMERGIDPGGVNPGSGWAARHLDSVPAQASLVRGFGHGNLLPAVLLGAPKTSAIADVSSLTLPVPGPYADQVAQDVLTDGQKLFAELTYVGGVAAGVTYLGTNRPAAKDAGQATFDTIDLFEDVDFDSPSPLEYPATAFGKAMRNTAKIIAHPSVYVEAVHIDIGGWDHHTNMNPLTNGGRMYELTQELSGAIAAFYEELGGTSGSHDEYLLMVYTEFGRQTKENDSLGTDHGTGSVMALMGKGIPVVGGGAGAGGSGIGGRVFRLGDQSSVFGPSVSDAVETRMDIRDVYAEALVNQLDLSTADVSTVFPGGFTPTYHGIVST